VPSTVCRFTLYMGPPLRLSALVTEPEHSLIHQSFQSKEREEPLNGDGFGVAWYAPALTSNAVAFRSVSPAWSNRNLDDLARVVESQCVLAHVRAATQRTSVSESNCHPFCAGPLAFMHNGDLAAFARVRRRFLGLLSDDAFGHIGGTTDSEHLFALFRDKLLDATGGDEPNRMANALRATIAAALRLVAEAGTDEPSYLNVAVSNGSAAVACRFTTDSPEHALSLYVSSGRRYVCENGQCRLIDPPPGEESVLVSSEPLTQDRVWKAIPANHLVLIREDRQIEIQPV
jgi:glutamine amidotransferase